MSTITISDTLTVNTVVWIRSLPEDELGPTRRILDDLAQLTPAGGLPVREHAVANRPELFELLTSLAQEAAQGLRPIIHLDAHGNEEAGLCLGPSKEWASWEDLLEAFRVINVQTQNNLVVVLALCFGLHLYKFVDVMKPVPAYLVIATATTVSVGFLEAETYAFYKALRDEDAFHSAFETTLAKKMTMMNCQGIFLEVLVHYVRTYCQGPARRERLNRLIATRIEQDGIANPSPQQLGEARRWARVALEPGEQLIARFAPQFLVGRKPKFTYAEVRRLVKGMR